jgi:hypothetical protein
MSTESRFQHAPLDTSKREIRLIKLHADLDSSGRIFIAMEHFELDTTTNSPVLLNAVPPYFALSYTWGDMVNKATISISGSLFNIGKNLYECLMVLRHVHPETYLWIDQLSIDQNDIRERNQQVQWMGDIFRRAKKVIVWLGPASENSDHAVSLIHNLKDLASEEDGSAVKDLLARPYWSRLWIVQEVILARDILVLCGSSMTSWSRFEDFLKGDFLFWNSDSHPAGNLIRTRLETRAPLLFEAILRFKENECKDPRDKVYGLVGLTGDGQQVPVDYSKSVSDIYTDVVLVLIHWMGDYAKHDQTRIIDQIIELGTAMGALSKGQGGRLRFKLWSGRGPYLTRSDLDFLLT